MEEGKESREGRKEREGGEENSPEDKSEASLPRSFLSDHHGALPAVSMTREKNAFTKPRTWMNKSPKPS